MECDSGAQLEATRSALQSFQERFRNIVNRSADGILIVDESGCILFVNPAGEEIFGKKACDLMGEEFGYPAIAGEKVEIEILHSAKVRCVVEMQVTETMWEEKTAFLAALRDVTERKRTEMEIQKLAQKCQLALDAAHMGWWHYDPLTQITSWDNRFREIFGATRDQCPNEKILARLHPEDLPGARAMMAAALDPVAPQPYSLECRVYLHDGSMRWIEAHGIVSFEGVGERRRATGMVGTVVDITERKHAQEALMRSNQELEQFAYVASHDLEEPLRAVIGFLQLLQSHYGEHLEAKGQYFIERSVKAAHRMQTLIRDLLTLSRVNANNATFMPTDLNHVVKDVLDNLQWVIKEKNVDITCARLPVLTIEVSQIRSLFQNLIVNAIRYNESPQPVIEIGCREQYNAYRFFVKDNGIGISPEFYQRIFMVFQRLHNDREYPGTGLGLALCKKIVELHGGKIWVESQLKEGSTFHFVLPVKRQHHGRNE